MTHYEFIQAVCGGGLRAMLVLAQCREDYPDCGWWAVIEEVVAGDRVKPRKTRSLHPGSLRLSREEMVALACHDYLYVEEEGGDVYVPFGEYQSALHSIAHRAWEATYDRGKDW